MKKAKVLVIGGGHIQLPLIEEGVKLGFEVFVVDDREGIIDPALAERIQRVPFNRHDKKSIVEYASTRAFDGIVSAGSDRSIKLMAECAAQCGISTYVSEASAALPLDKLRMAALLRAAGLPAPRYDFVESYEQAASLAEALGYPVVVKPVDGTGQEGVGAAADPEQLQSVVNSALNASVKSRAIIQEFVEGVEYSLSGFIYHGRVAPFITSYRGSPSRTEAGFGVALTKQYPTDLPAALLDQLRADMETALQQMGVETSPFFAQVIVTSSPANQYRIIEVMPRIGGGEEARFVRAATGFNLAKATLLAALGREFDVADLIDAEGSKAVLLKFFTTENGVLKSISGLDEAQSLDGVREVKIYPRIGDRVTSLNDSNDRAGYLMTVGATPAEAERVSALATAKVRLEVEAVENDETAPGHAPVILN
ncbi:ATP-grasp domain-containing protein [Hahella sp. CR1]|uniref:ATP-binding protein n=1 Tax=Hahella sp. CR1 TaxID=2992807 RepID=UPI002441B627|nr:ATP-grasp domain-containing protein [Hahella sp. CR1]MDG9669455.1 ATP-grasp domain-containing protein [Hahella sp. CR1]